MRLTRPDGCGTAAQTAMQRLFPDWDTLNSLHAALTEGERELVSFLDANLPEGWSIFVQPHLNGLRPDVVVATPNVGVVVFEVKDWRLGSYCAQGDRLIGRSASQEWEAQNPILKARIYAAQIYERFLAGREAEGEPRGSYKPQKICRPAVYFHCATTEEACDLLKPWLGDEEIVFGRDWLDRQRLQQIVPSCYHKRRQGMDETTSDAIARLIVYLMPPRHFIEQQRPLPMPDRVQEPKAVPGQGFHRIRGPVGCGKSFVLVHRALRANHEGREVLVVSHNVTMSHWLHDLISRSPYRVDKHRLGCNHFHAWCIQTASQAGLLRRLPIWGRCESDVFGDDGESALSDGNLFDEAFRALTERFDSGATPEDLGLPRYGGIYVDEVQDFEARWLDLLARFLEQDGEMVIVADQRQNLYGREGGRDVPERGHRACRFRGRWIQLGSRSYRLPWRAARFLEAFSQATGLGDDEDEPIQPRMEPTLEGTEHERFGWIRATDNEEALELLAETIRWFQEFHPSDVCVLVPTHGWGLRAFERIKGDFGPIVHVFSTDGRERQARKKAFWKGRGELKMCTIHSFKGWQIENVVLLWPSPLPGDGYPDAVRHRLFYSAASRALRNLFVINADRGYDPLLRLGGHLEELKAGSSEPGQSGRPIRPNLKRF